jgi:hypothetical protein
MDVRGLLWFRVVPMLLISWVFLAILAIVPARPDPFFFAGFAI